MSRPTLGPWHVNAILKGRIVGDETAPLFEKLHINGTNNTVAQVYRGPDARLIAAAPEMLALAKHVKAMTDDAHLVGHPEWRAIADEATAIIRKATGGENPAT